MADPKPKSPFAGRWRIVSTTQWDRDYLDEEVEAFVEFNAAVRSNFHFGYVQGEMDVRETTRDGVPAVEWSWEGNDESEQVQGRGWAVLKGDELHGTIYFHQGDESEFVATRLEKKKKAKATPRPRAKATPKGEAAAGAVAYRFEVTLRDTDPPIWRRIEVLDCTLDRLHYHIQAAMGWGNSHLYQFTIQKRTFGDPGLVDDNPEEMGDSTAANLDDVLPKKGKRFRFEYEYDFGDSWRHEIVFEGRVPAGAGKPYPVCVEGERACPPEDIGGTIGFRYFLDAMADGKGPRYEEPREWYEGPYDAAVFDPKEATRRMAR